MTYICQVAFANIYMNLRKIIFQEDFMRAYWPIVGLEPLMTAYSAGVVVDRKTGKEYPTGDIVFLKKCDAPKQLVENLSDKYKFICAKEEKHIETEGFFRHKITVITKTVKPPFEGDQNLTLFWVIEGLKPTVYTSRACTWVRDRKTGKKYKRSEKGEIFRDESFPEVSQLAEYSGKFDIIYDHVSQSTLSSLSSEDYLRDIWVTKLFK